MSFIIETIYKQPSKKIAKRWDNICKEEGGIGYVETNLPEYQGNFVLPEYNAEMAQKVKTRIYASMMGLKGGASKSEKKLKAIENNLGAFKTPSRPNTRQKKYYGKRVIPANPEARITIQVEKLFTAAYDVLTKHKTGSITIPDENLAALTEAIIEMKSYKIIDILKSERHTLKQIQHKTMIEDDYKRINQHQNKTTENSETST